MKLKNYFQIGIAVGLFVAVVSGVIALRGREAQGPLPGDMPENFSEDDDSTATTETDAREQSANKTAAPSPEVQKTSARVDLVKATEFFAVSIKQMSSCLNIGNSDSAERQDPTVDSLLGILKPTIGDPILRAEDWSVWSLRTSNGGQRRIRVEADFSDSGQISRRLSYFEVDANGSPTLIPLPEESTKDPSETFIASLQKDGEVYEESKGERAYFDGGQEISLTQKNGFIESYEVANGVKTFRCTGVLTSTPSCNCN